LVFDVETNGRLDETTVMHCLVLRDIDSDRVVSCTNSAPGFTSLEEGLSLLSEAERVYGHNIITFDSPVIQKLYPGFKMKGELRDTLVIASMRFNNVKDADFQRFRAGTLPGHLIGKHSLEAWGYRLGVKKVGVEIEDWSTWTPLMQSRCVSDTAVNKALVERIRAAGVSNEAVETEHELAQFLFYQERNGWPFDIVKAVALQGKLAGERQVVEQKLRDFFGFWFAPNGETISKVNNKTKGIAKGAHYTKLKVIEFNPGSHKHIARCLDKLYGWKPTEFTEKSGDPKIDENVLKGLPYPPIADLRRYLLLDKRLGQLAEGKEAWLKHTTTESPVGGKITGLPHIHCHIWQSGTITHRGAHVKPNLGQVPKVGSPFGEECRELFTAGPSEFVMLGADVSGLELRVLSHYMAKWDDGKYAKLILEGDVHSVTLEALIEWLGVLDPKRGRDRAKTWYYAYLYGAGDVKLGKILLPGKTPEEHKRIGLASRRLFEAKLIALGELVASIKRKAKKFGYLKLIDGRRCYIRSDHSALNSLIQGTGAVICKRWIVEYNRRFVREFGQQGWRGDWASLMWSHDETQTAIKPGIVEPAKLIIVSSIEHMTDHFNFRCPLTGAAKVGLNWKETH
jgi:DNA polymerase-1